MHIRMKGKLIWIGKALLVLLVAPLLLVIVITVMPYVMFTAATDWVKSRVYCIQNSGKMYLVVDGQHGWRELVDNNLITALPAEITPIWYDSAESVSFRTKALRNFWNQRPFLVLLTINGPVGISVHERLLPFKENGKRDEKIRASVRAIIVETAKQLKEKTVSESV